MNRAIIESYGGAWNRHDVEAILALHSDDAVFENHTLSWDGTDVMPLRDGLVARKDVYADSISFLRQLGVAVP